jgi:hypothetical protein
MRQTTSRRGGERHTGESRRANESVREKQRYGEAERRERERERSREEKSGKMVKSREHHTGSTKRGVLLNATTKTSPQRSQPSWVYTEKVGLVATRSRAAASCHAPN